MMGGGMSTRAMYKAGSSNPKKIMAAKNKKSKKKKSFPDLKKDGKVTFADVLQGRLKGKAKA